MKKITDKLLARQNANYDNPGVTFAFLGDSVTQGCFDCYRKSEDSIETVFDKNSAYHKYLADIFTVLYPNVPVNIINAGISGDNATHALTRLERDVIKFSPDLVVVCFGLNDCGKGLEGIDEYKNSLSEIFDRLKNADCEVIFMTPNIMCTELSCHLTDDMLKDIAQNVAKRQNDGVLDAYIDAAKSVCITKNVKVCDCYAKWKKLADIGINTTNLLSNYINHPTREMNWMFAYSLAETILGI